MGSHFHPYLSLAFFTSLMGMPIRTSCRRSGLPVRRRRSTTRPARARSTTISRTDNTYALFTDETFHFTDKLELNTGFRYSIDFKTLNQVSNNIGGGAACAATNASSAIVPCGDGGGVSVGGAMRAFLSPGYNDFTNHQTKQEGAPAGTAKPADRVDPQRVGLSCPTRAATRRAGSTSTGWSAPSGSRVARPEALR